MIDPRRLHLTLGVMHLNDEFDPPTSAASTTSPDSPRAPTRTIMTALALLDELWPVILEAISGRKAAKVKLQRLNALKMERKKEDEGVDAGVLYPAPEEAGEEGERSRAVADSLSLSFLFYCSRADAHSLMVDLVHQTLKKEGYIIENWPLMLHCTIINTSHRRLRNLRLPFSYTDILSSQACRSIADVKKTAASPATADNAQAYTIFRYINCYFEYRSHRCQPRTNHRNIHSFYCLSSITGRTSYRSSLAFPRSPAQTLQCPPTTFKHLHGHIWYAHCRAAAYGESCA